MPTRIGKDWPGLRSRSSRSDRARAESRDLVVGGDGKPRCAWAGGGNSGLSRYHDDVWGKRTYDRSAMFEALTLGVFEVGLSWSTVFQKRDAFRKAFRDFDPTRIATMTERDVDRLVQDASIIRNRAKIQSTVDNARAMLSASPSLVALARSYAVSRTRAPRSLAELPTSTRQAEAFAKQLKAQGYRFVGPTSVYAFMQNVGVVNDHVHGCFRATDYRAGALNRRSRGRQPAQGSFAAPS
jgi:DNA-3-methyladenine glycosylase I